MTAYAANKLTTLHLTLGEGAAFCNQTRASRLQIIQELPIVEHTGCPVISDLNFATVYPPNKQFSSCNYNHQLKMAETKQQFSLTNLDLTSLDPVWMRASSNWTEMTKNV